MQVNSTAPVMCEHHRLWTTCPDCGKDAIKAARRRRTSANKKREEPTPESMPSVPARPESLESAPEEPEPTPFEKH